MLAKTVIVRGPDRYAMAVLPADCKIDLEQLASTMNLDHLRLATEEEVRMIFPESEVGAMPPFGAPVGMPVYLDVRLADEPYILFNAGTHRDAMHMRVADYIRLADPSITSFAYPDNTSVLAGPMAWR
jgi:Ala-tRNA(Pro) deacylase